MAKALLAILIATNVLTFLGLSHGDVARLGRPILGSYVVVGWWLLTAVVLLWAARVRDRARPAERGGQPYSGRAMDQQVWVVAIILILAFLFRSAELDRLPWGYAGIHPDAAYNGDMAFRILDGVQPFSPVLASKAFARDCLTHYYLAAFFAVFGRTIETLRLACNVLGLLNCFLVFLIMRNYSQSAFATAATVAAYAFSPADTVFALSGQEYVMATPFLLGSFVLFERAMRRGTLVDAVLAGFTWGLGFSSHYSYMFLGFVVPAIAILNLKTVKPWLPTFAVAGFLGMLPKASYLVFDQADYFVRFHDVARHDSAGRFLVPGYFSASAAHLMDLIFKTQAAFKWLLPEDPIISSWHLPLILLGLAVALFRPRRPEHAFVLLVVVLTIAVNFAAFVMDYRVMNAMPIIFLLLGMVVVTAEKVLRVRGGRALLSVLIGAGVVEGLAGYFSHDDNEVLRDVYGTREVALARSIKKLGSGGGVYVLAPHLTYRLNFLNLDYPNIEQPNENVSLEFEERFSRPVLTKVMGNVERALASEATRHAPVRFIISPASPYGDSVRQFLMTAPGARLESWDVKDPVSHESTHYYLVSIEDAAQAMEQWRTREVTLPKKPLDEAKLRRGMLSLTTFAGPDQVVPVDERQVPAVFDFDFRKSVPYPGEWDSNFSLRWSGYLLAGEAGEYRVTATFDDGCRVFVDDHPLFTDWTLGAARTATATISLDAGWHPIRIDYFQLINEARLLFEVRRDGKHTAQLSVTDFASDSEPRTLSENQQQRP